MIHNLIKKLREKNKIINNTSINLAYHPKINKISQKFEIFYHEVIIYDRMTMPIKASSELI